MPNSTLFLKTYPIEGGDFTKAGTVSTQIKGIIKSLGINSTVVRRVAISTYEAEMNVVMYAKRGKLIFTVTPKMIEVVLIDEGQGIEDIEKAMQEGYSTATDEMREMGFGAGMGLPNIRRNSDEFHINSAPGKGTTLNIRIYTGA